ncbi:Na+/H+ antiporter subunit E [Hydrogenobacter sp. T-2]|uniref:Na+/H+ antiporter subunit E n=1 Tax=Pampinifervens diazotrophicum TaxID=1632018 RepID=UPI002B25CFD4|nr:Na+/H+ antiporter subunit E [Hydrogenobacter sp. T-2]WPM32912.1 Na+/H+ antiporter subunit E [Hydrogenobacter sp. T-2]
MLVLAVLYSLLWIAIAGYDLKSVFFGVLAVGSALFVHITLGLYPPRINPIALFEFLGVFLWQALLGGIDVARRIVSPQLRVNPGFVVYNFQSEKLWVKILLALTINLTPGTLSVVIEDKQVLVHTLDVESYSEESVRSLEGLLDRVFS